MITDSDGVVSITTNNGFMATYNSNRNPNMIIQYGRLRVPLGVGGANFIIFGQ
jgi:hypothetical protein